MGVCVCRCITQDIKINGYLKKKEKYFSLNSIYAYNDRKGLLFLCAKWYNLTFPLQIETHSFVFSFYFFCLPFGHSFTVTYRSSPCVSLFLSLDMSEIFICFRCQFILLLLLYTDRKRDPNKKIYLTFLHFVVVAIVYIFIGFVFHFQFFFLSPDNTRSIHLNVVGNNICCVHTRMPAHTHTYSKQYPFLRHRAPSVTLTQFKTLANKLDR